MCPVYIIAEAGVNHNGSISNARRLIDIAAEAKADAVKFQTFKTAKLVSKSAPLAEYQKRNLNQQDTQFEMLRKLELSEDDHFELRDYCKEREIEFLSTPFDTDSLEFLVKRMKLDRIKISSGDLTNLLLLLRAAQYGVSIILSTGMATLSEVELALSIIAYGYLHPSASTFPAKEKVLEAWRSEQGQKLLMQKVILLHCTTEYPAPIDEVNLKAMNTLRDAFQLRVGYSDHTDGITIPVAAAAMGAAVIEKHFTLDRTMEGPDHKASLEPGELVDMVNAVRNVEAAMGTGIKLPSSSEIKNKAIARKSIVAATAILEGEIYSIDNLTVKRPGNGLEPSLLWNLIGQKATRSYEKDEPITGL